MNAELQDYISVNPHMAVAIERGLERGLTEDQLIEIYINTPAQYAVEIAAMSDEELELAAGGVVAAGFPRPAVDEEADEQFTFNLGLSLSVIQEVERATAFAGLLSHEDFPSAEVERRTETVLAETDAIDAYSVALAHEIAVGTMPMEEALLYAATVQGGINLGSQHMSDHTDGDAFDDEVFED